MMPILDEDLAYIHRQARIANQFDDAVIVLTGCAGFLGFYFLQYFVRYARRLGLRKVIGLDSFLLRAPDWLVDLRHEYPDVLELERFDISKDDLSAVKDIGHATFVVHMASVASPSLYRQFPLETVDANVWGLRRLLDFYSASHALKGLLFFSSSEIYGDPDAANVPTGEDYRGYVSSTGPRACYDESKRFGETLCAIFARKFELPITVARPFNNYGPGMRVDDKRLPADFAQCVVRGDDITILSNGSPTRTFCYVSDAIAGYLLCLLHGRYDFFNIGIEKPEISVRTLAEIYHTAGREIFDYSGTIRYAQSGDKDYLTDNPNRRCPKIEKARTLLGYSPGIGVDDGIRRYLRFLATEARK